MSTARSFNSMLNEFLPFELLREEAIKRDYVLANIQKDDSWKGGSLIVPFQGGFASSWRAGSLTAANDIAEDTYVRGSISAYKEIWGSMLFNHRDLVEHGAVAGQSEGMVREQSFLKILPDTLDAFMDNMKQAVSVNLLNGTHFAKLTSDGATAGTMVVDHPERFQVDQKVIVDDDNSSSATGYVARSAGINLNTKTIKLVASRGGTTAVDLSAYTVAQNAKCYHEDADTSTNVFTPLKNQLLSAANGGDATLFGQTKVNYPLKEAA